MVPRDAKRFMLLLWRAFRRLRRRWPVPVLLGLGYANLGWGLAAHPEEMRLATRIAVDVVHANFGLLLGAALVCGSAVLGRGRSASGVAARAVALVAVATGALALALAMAMLAQAWRGDVAVDLAAYGLGVLPGLGVQLAQLAALAVFAQSLLRGWPGAAATAAACILAAVLPAHFGLEHPLLPFALPPLVWSDMAGFGPFLPAQVAAGVAWSASAVLLLVAAHWIGGRRRPTRRSVAVAWVAGLLAAVAGGWLLTTDREAPAAGRLVPSPPSAQLRYHRLALDLEIDPRARRVAVQGVAILAHAGEAALADLHFALPAGLVLDAVQVTGERLPSPPRTRRFRLNRPLDPGETLRLGFTGTLQASAWPGRNEAPRLLANGTAFALAEILPIVTKQSPLEQSASLRAQVGTSLEQLAVAPGERRGAWREEGRAYYEFETSQPVPLAATIHAGRYLRIEYRAGVVAFVHPPHRKMVERLLARGAPATPTRLVEVPDLSRVGPVPGLGALAPPSNRAGQTAAGIVPISELAIVSGGKAHFD